MARPRASVRGGAARAAEPGGGLCARSPPDGVREHRRGVDYFRFQEAVILQGVRHRQREVADEVPARPYPPGSEGLLSAFDDQLEFSPTAGQRDVERLSCAGWEAAPYESAPAGRSRLR
ncbi:hypothetical protein [Nesterenkonia pannonica]|uniref:hypothetical protein n=1 Tax=Nesterenkonia pannonica TaxID=1548602 RepID=UPI0021646621|nr:hypothetical protein [Nesterenkonia pannonica]